MKVAVVYAKPERQTWITLEVPEGTTVGDAIYRSGIKDRFPEIDFGAQKIGIFGKLVTFESPVEEGSRIEIYRPITVDPSKVKRRPAPPKAKTSAG
ncbi:MAG: RnfH family protein [Rhodospirillaceae bacterium]